MKIHIFDLHITPLFDDFLWLIVCSTFSFSAIITTRGSGTRDENDGGNINCCWQLYLNLWLVFCTPAKKERVSVPLRLKPIKLHRLPSLSIFQRRLSFTTMGVLRNRNGFPKPINHLPWMIHFPEQLVLSSFAPSTTPITLCPPETNLVWRAENVTNIFSTIAFSRPSKMYFPKGSISPQPMTRCKDYKPVTL